EFTSDENGEAFAWFINEPTANARFTPGNHVYLRIRINDGQNGTTVAHTFTTEDYATVLNFGTENDEYSGSAFYAKSVEAAMTFAMLFSSDDDWRPTYSTTIETIGVDYGSINQYADFYKEEVAGNDGWFGGIVPNDNENGINIIWILDMESYVINDYYTENGEWHPEANTVNPTNGLDEPIFIDLTYDGVDEQEVEAKVKVWNADHEFIIENGDNSHYTMTVYNVLGQPMMQQQINAGSTERISHSLATGVYIINLQNNQNSVSVKVIVR
ncbi:MAG: T9SS type A sorting domain-containing protein, partial [Bacteroidales bacterium]|nr:T9SS type A sorting domain-containing protein [Bacteroidales bacterium]